jgi:hypothetical protein
VASWNPAVPPAPVAGAAVGNGRADERRVGDGRAVALGVVARAVRLAEAAGTADAVPPVANGVGVAEGEDPAQAETDAAASMVKLAQPMAASLALSLVPAMAVRISWDLLTRPARAVPRKRLRPKR